MGRTGWLTAAWATLLSGCGTYSFGPPDVSLNRRTPGQELADMCAVPVGGMPIPAVTDRPTVEDALALVHNYIGAYRCTMRIAADGRQSWQLPGFLALAGAATATALGGGRDWAIAGGAANSMFSAGNSYYNHVEQARILQDAIDAFGCIETEAVGVEAFAKAPAAANAAGKRLEAETRAALEEAETRLAAAERRLSRADAVSTEAANQLSNARSKPELMSVSVPREVRAAAERELASAESAAAAARIELTEGRNELTFAQADLDDKRAAWVAAVQAVGALGEVEVSAERQYFNMIMAALIGVEAVAARRLADRASSYDPAGVVAQIKDLSEKAKKAEEDAKKGDATGPAARAAELYSAPGVGDKVKRIRLELDAVRPRLAKCILRAQASVGEAAE